MFNGSLSAVKKLLTVSLMHWVAHALTPTMTFYPIYCQTGGKMTKIDTLFMTKAAEKPYPLGPHIPI